MGMSASQARLLSLTARLSDLEYQAQSISNSKIRLADASAEASTNYMNALDNKKLTVMSSDTSTYVDANAYNLTTYGAVSSTDKQRFLVDASGRNLVTTKVGNSFDASKNSGSQSFTLKQQYSTVNAYLDATLKYHDQASFTAAQTAGTVATTATYDSNAVNYHSNLYSGKEDFLNGLGYTSNPNNNESVTGFENESGANDYYGNVFDQISKNGYNAVGDSNMKDSEWLYDQLSSGNIFLVEDTSSTSDDDWEQVSYSSGDATIATEDDKTETAKAEAEYETTMAEIQSKDKRFDLQLKQIDTEHSAIQTEIDSVKKVIDKNIERSFKIFNA